jgi:hypothetical protein
VIGRCPEADRTKPIVSPYTLEECLQIEGGNLGDEDKVLSGGLFSPPTTAPTAKENCEHFCTEQGLGVNFPDTEQLGIQACTDPGV